MRDTGEVLTHVELGGMRIPPTKRDRPVQRGNASLSDTTGKCVVNQELLERRFAHIENRVMQYALTKTRCCNHALLWIENRELNGLPQRQRFREHRSCEFRQVSVQILAECTNIPAIAFPTNGS